MNQPVSVLDLAKRVDDIEHRLDRAYSMIHGLLAYIAYMDGPVIDLEKPELREFLAELPSKHRLQKSGAIPSEGYFEGAAIAMIGDLRTKVPR